MKNETKLGARTVLDERYKRCLKYVNDKEYFKHYAREKIIHSRQVVGAGNYIIKHEKTFAGKTEQQRLYAYLSYLFHDIGRFEEIEKLYDMNDDRGNDISFDHGVMGATILEQYPEYNIPQIILPVRHHGHLPEELPADEDFKQLKDKSLKQDVIDNFNLTCDADKIANFNLFTQTYTKMKAVIYGHMTIDELESPVSERVWDYIQQRRLIPREWRYSLSDRILGVIAWVFELNYKPSFDYCFKLNLFAKQLKVLADHNPDKVLQAEIEKFINSFIQQKYQQLIGCTHEKKIYCS